MANMVNIDELARLWNKGGLSLTSRRYRQLAKEGHVPDPVKGMVDAPLALIKLAAYYHQQSSMSGDLSLTDERTRLTRINADKKELELQKAKGELIKTEIAVKLWGGIIVNIKKKLDQIVAKLPPLAYGLTIPEIKSVTERIIFEVSSEIANPDLGELARMDGRKKGVAPVKATGDSKRKPVGRQKPDVKPGGKRGAGKVVHVKG